MKPISRIHHLEMNYEHPLSSKFATKKHKIAFMLLIILHNHNHNKYSYQQRVPRSLPHPRCHCHCLCLFVHHYACHRCYGYCACSRRPSCLSCRAPNKSTSKAGKTTKMVTRQPFEHDNSISSKAKADTNHAEQKTKTQPLFSTQNQPNQEPTNTQNQTHITATTQPT